MSLVLAAFAIAVTWWPASRIESRMESVAGRVGAQRIRVSPAVLVLLCAPIVALSVGGFAGAGASSIVVALVVWLRRRRRRTAEHEEQRDDMLTALGLMIAELSVGAPPARACAEAAQELSRQRGATCEVAEGLTVLAARAELGGRIVVDQDDAHGVSRSRQSASTSTLQSWRRIAVAWQTAEHRGSPWRTCSRRYEPIWSRDAHSPSALAPDSPGRGRLRLCWPDCLSSESVWVRQPARSPCRCFSAEVSVVRCW